MTRPEDKLPWLCISVPLSNSPVPPVLPSSSWLHRLSWSLVPCLSPLHQGWDPLDSAGEPLMANPLSVPLLPFQGQEAAALGSHTA